MVTEDEQEDGFADGEDSDERGVQVGQGYLHETFNQRSDHDSRRYRVFQHYLRSDGQTNKRSRQNRWKRRSNNVGSKEKGEQNWSSSASSSSEKEDNKTENNNCGPVNGVCGGGTHADYTEKAHRRAERDKKMGRHNEFKRREELEKRRDEQKILLAKFKHERDPDKKARMKAELSKTREQEATEQKTAMAGKEKEE